MAKSKGKNDTLTDPLSALRIILPREAFSDAELRELIPFSEILTYDAGTALITEGDPSDNRVYFLLSGSLSVYIQEKFILNLTNPGDSVGEMGLISAAPRSATVRTDSPSSILVFNASLDQSVSEDDDYRFRYYLSRIFNTILTEKLRKTSNRAKLYEDMVTQTRGLQRERVGLEQEIAQYLEQISLYTHLVNSAKDTIIITDTNGHILNANKSLHQDFGIETDQVVGKEITELLDWKNGGNVSWSEIVATAKKGGWNQEVTLVHPSGVEIPADCSISVVQDNERNFLAASVILRNIAVRKALEAETHRQRLQLEEAYRQIQVMDRVKSNFLNMVSHELRTPISNILAYSEMLTMEDMVEPEDRPGFLQIIHDEAGKLAEMVNKVMAIAKLESGQMFFNFAENRLEEVVRNLVVKMRPKAEEKNLKIDFTCQEGMAPVVFDEENLGEAVEQVLDNAVRYTEHGKIQVEVRQNEGKSVIRIQDTGKGIGKGEIGEVLEKFGRGDQVNIGTHGLGLGLPLSYMIVKAHAGEMNLESVPEGGTVVSIKLPLKQETPDSAVPRGA
ncbi:MAG: cyclic nucleotide-binding domain-containing protein [SAR324 cluster bacterium]|nr:cyclic nucleotide-binding domain-containing protein [SAR324 cluster bacterium]